MRFKQATSATLAIIGVALLGGITSPGNAATIDRGGGPNNDNPWDLDPGTAHFFDIADNPVSYEDGDDTVFDSNFDNVSVEDVVSPASITVPDGIKVTFTDGGGEIAGAGAMNVNGGTVEVDVASSYSGGTTVSNGGKLSTDPSLTQLGAGAITLDGAEFGAGNPGSTFSNDFIVTASGAQLNDTINTAVEYTGSFTLSGNLTMGTGQTFARPRITGLITADADVTITGGTGFSNQDHAVQLNGGLSAPGNTITLDSVLEGLGVNGGMWNVAELILKGSTTTGGDATIEPLKWTGVNDDATDVLRITEGQVLLPNATDTFTVSEFWLGGTKQTAVGTYGSLDNVTADFQTSYITGDGTVSLSIIPEPATAALAGFGGLMLLSRRRRRG